jgi:nucleoside-triphosphatase
VKRLSFPPQAKNLLLTGPPGVGKSTVIQKTLSLLSLRAEGFFTAEIREGGRRLGFRLTTLSGEEATLAHRDLREGPRVGPYGVDVRALERVGVAALRRALSGDFSLIVIDEIGKMEMKSRAFRDIVLQCLDSPRRVLGVIGKGAPEEEKIRRRPDVLCLEVTPKNRDSLPKVLSVWAGSEI